MNIKLNNNWNHKKSIDWSRWYVMRIECCNSSSIMLEIYFEQIMLFFFQKKFLWIILLLVSIVRHEQYNIFSMSKRKKKFKHILYILYILY